MASFKRVRLTQTQRNSAEAYDQLDKEIWLFQQTEFAEHKAECMSRNGTQAKMPTPSASSLWRKGLEKWGSRWLERDRILRQKF